MASIVVQITGKSSAKISIVKINLCIELIQEKFNTTYELFERR